MKNLTTIILICMLTFVCYACNEKSQEQNDHGDHESEAAAQGHAEEHDEVSLSTEQFRTVGITLGRAEYKNLGASVKVNGKLEVPAQNKAAITALSPGVLQTLLVHPGSEVRKGQVIATIINTEVSGLQQELASVNARLNLAGLEYNRQKELVAGNAAPLKNLQRAQAEQSSLQAQQAALKQQLATLGISTAARAGSAPVMTLRAPISGTISDIHAQIGSRVDIATPVAMIVNNSQLHLDLFVYEKDLPSIAKGQTIHFTLTNNPGTEYDATIFSIGTAFADGSQAVPVHADVQGNKTGLIEGMNVTAVISIGHATAMAVPDEAIVSNGGKDYILVQENATEPELTESGKPRSADGTLIHFKRIQVVKGASDLGFTEIHPVAALPADAKIVFKGAFFIMAKMTNTGGHEH